MQHVQPEVSTICVGMGMSAAAMILAGGAAGTSAKIMIHEGSTGTRGAPRDMEIHLREVMSTTKRMARILAHHCHRPLEQVERDLDRDYYLTAHEALEYGLIDEVIQPRRGVSAAVLETVEQAAATEAAAAPAAR